MEGVWAGSVEEKEKIIKEIVSDYNYKMIPINLRGGISIPAGGDVVGVELTSETPRVFVSYAKAAAGPYTVSPHTWWLASDLRDLACLPWGKGISAATAVFDAFSSPTSVPTTYTSMTYEELLTQCKNLESQNEYYRRELSAVYTPERLQRNSILFGFLSLGSLLLSSFLDINILHPIAGYLIFGISFVFYLMSFIMKREEKK